MFTLLFKFLKTSMYVSSASMTSAIKRLCISTYYLITSSFVLFVMLVSLILPVG